MTNYSLTPSTSTVAYPLPSFVWGTQHAVGATIREGWWSSGHHPSRRSALPKDWLWGRGRGSSCSTTVILYGINLFLSYFTQFAI